MAERRRHKKRIQEVGEPSKEEKAVAKYLRFNCPTKSTNMMGHRVDYFIASKAVDCLLDSKWAKAKKGEEALFTTRESVVDYCNRPQEYRDDYCLGLYLQSAYSGLLEILARGTEHSETGKYE
uniref:Translocation protein SEC62 n=1 Tax=Equus caballus TaxID=9796 RepID=A0A9L0SVA7_HORSE